MGSASLYYTYYYELHETAMERYRDKLQNLGGLGNPYLENFMDDRMPIDWHLRSDMEYPDIYNFLIATPSLYIGDSLKAYKSLDVYNYYASGWVDQVSFYRILPSNFTYLSNYCWG